MGTPAGVRVGPGLIYVAPLGTSEPATPTASIPSAWVPVGYTEEGHVFTTETTSEPVEVAEELDPIRYVNTRRTGSFEVELAEINLQNFAIAHNGGSISGPTGGFVSFEPPDIGDEVRLAVLWRDDANEEQLVVRQVLSTGAVAIQRRKAPAKATIPLNMRMEKPTSGAKSFKAWSLASLSYDDPHT
jgi:hypothetical protein